MSYTNILVFDENGDYVKEKSFQNSWLGHFAYWEILKEEYGLDYGTTMFSENGGYGETWNAYATGKYKRFEDIVLQFTFDNRVFHKDTFELLSNRLKEFDKEYGKNRSTHAKKQAEFISTLINDTEAYYIAINGTSVSEQWFSHEYDVEDENGKYHEEILTNIIKHEESVIYNYQKLIEKVEDNK